MRHNLRLIPLLPLLIAFVPVVFGYTYQCEPGTDPTVCSIRFLRYDGDDSTSKHPNALPTVNVTASVRSVRLLCERYYHRYDTIDVYDTILHTTVLHSPATVTLIDNRVRRLIIPPNLEMGDFTNNFISVIETEPNRTYVVRYLDVSHNSLSDVANLTVLTGLQTLNLRGNRIATIDQIVFTRMDNLTYLYLGDNRFITFDLRTMPKGMVVLMLSRNDLKDLSFAGVSLPALTELDLEHNALTLLDLAALFSSFPALRMLTVESNPFTKEEANRIIDDLKRHNVSYYFGMELDDEVECDSDEYSVDKLCFTATILGVRTVWKALFLMLLCVLVVGIFGFSVRWIWYQMRY